MSTDKSRSTSDRDYDYTGVVSQQGRVIVDRDFNALQDIIDGRVEADALDVIGPCGTPDDGFAVSLPVASPPSLSPPTAHGFDFLIAPGTMYVGGQRVVFPARPPGHPITYSYFDQPDWINPTDPLRFPFAPNELVYLHLTEQEVGAVEDPDLLDAALGGVDTTQRLRLLRRVQRLPVTTADCTAAWQQAVNGWRAGGQLVDPQSLALVPQAELKVSFVQGQAVTDPCDPLATGGYLGAENQLIRVQIGLSDPTNPSGPRVLVWGYDNASFLYRVAAVKPNGTMLQLTRDPPDAFHIPGTGQVVEILRTAAVLEIDPDTTDPLHQRTIVRCVAESTGVLAALASPYGPAQPGDPTNYIVLNAPLPEDYLSDPNPLFVRVWQAQLPIGAAGGTVELIDPANQTTTGVQVTISVAQNEALTAGIYWLIAVRPSTPQAVYPERLLIAPQPPDGPRQWVCPLAVIDWRRAVVHDCRCQFDNLVTLTKRRPGCCTVSVSPEDLTQSNTLQSIIDRAAGLAQAVRVCLNPGTYVLGQSLRLTAVHSGMAIEACTGGVTIQGAPNAAPAAFFDGLVMLSGAAGVTLRGISFEPPVVAVSQFLSQSATSLLQLLWAQWMGAAVAASVLSDIAAMIAVRVVNSQNFTAERCGFRLSASLSPPSVDVLGLGILLQGACSGVTVQGCNFDSDVAPTFTPKIVATQRTGLAAETAAPARASAAADGAVMRGTASTEPVATGPNVASDAAELARMFHAGVAASASPETAESARLALSQLPVGILVPAGPGVFRQPLVVTVGCLSEIAVDVSPQSQQSAPCQLGNATLRDNRFHNLTWAVFSWADAVTARLEENNVAQCGGGFWVQLTNSLGPSGTLYSQAFAAITSFQEYPIFWLLPALLYPVREIIGIGGPAAVAPSAFSLFITNNQVETILPVVQLSPPSSPPQGGTPSGQGSSSLVVLANRAVAPNTDTTTSLAVSNNRLRSQNALAPTTLIVVPDNQQRSVVSANLIFNELRQPAVPGAVVTNGPSLDIIPNSLTVVALFTVVGNALLGPTNLGTLARSDPTTTIGNTWVPFNSIVP